MLREIRIGLESSVPACHSETFLSLLCLEMKREIRAQPKYMS